MGAQTTSMLDRKGWIEPWLEYCHATRNLRSQPSHLESVCQCKARREGGSRRSRAEVRRVRRVRRATSHEPRATSHEPRTTNHEPSGAAMDHVWWTHSGALGRVEAGRVCRVLVVGAASKRQRQQSQWAAPSAVRLRFPSASPQEPRPTSQPALAALPSPS
jgi:hypothetical protein